jgi:ABC-type Zn uptake system ZnuABC Zn-binding protein ZnuA
LRLSLAVALAALLGIWTLGCGSGAGGVSRPEDEILVSATISVIEDLVEEVGGDRVEVFSLVPAGADVHTFQPSPSDAREISASAVVFQNGLGLEGWMGDLIESAGGEDQTVVVLSEGLEPLDAEEHGDEHSSEEEHGAGEAHEHAEGNPHLWLDVHNAEHYVERIRDALAEADPEGAEEYGANAEEYLAELQELDAYIEEQARSIPEEDRKLVTFHDAFPYFAAAYGFELVDVIIQNPEAEPSGRQAAQLVRRIEEERVPAVFTEPQFNQGLADTIAAEANVEVYELYSDSLVDDPEADSYVSMMRTNIDRAKEGLG